MTKHNVIWCINHLKILRAKNNGAKTIHEIYKSTNLAYRTIQYHLREILQCPYCHNFVDKTVFCAFCGFRLVESYG